MDVWLSPAGNHIGPAWIFLDFNLSPLMATCGTTKLMRNFLDQRCTAYQSHGGPLALYLALAGLAASALSSAFCSGAVLVRDFTVP